MYNRHSQLGHFKLVFHFVMNKKPIREEHKNKLEVPQNVSLSFFFSKPNLVYSRE